MDKYTDLDERTSARIYAEYKNNSRPDTAAILKEYREAILRASFPAEASGELDEIIEHCAALAKGEERE